MTEIKKGHVEAGGVRYGYEIHGAGAPAINFSPRRSWGRWLVRH
jgi:hypothetical protein